MQNKNTPDVTEKRCDRRSAYTKNVIEEAFFSLLEKTPFSKISVSSICSHAQISRGTFYIHYEDKFDLARKVINKVLDENRCDPSQEGFSDCRTLPSDSRYINLYRDNDLSAMLVARIIERNASTKIPMIMKATGLDEKQSFAVFTYVVHGGLAVNRLYEWKKSSEWEEVQPSIQSFIQGGMSQLAAKNNDSLD